MHAADPVRWAAWGPEALARARREGKLVLVSSGYFACPWCHVMQRESFRDPEVAAVLNRHFVAVKVDRELLPALDAELVRFVEQTDGRAGWPLNAFLTPAGHPLLGTVYLPRDEFLGLLRGLQQRWASEREALAAVAAEAAKALGDPPAQAGGRSVSGAGALTPTAGQGPGSGRGTAGRGRAGRRTSRAAPRGRRGGSSRSP